MSPTCANCGAPDSGELVICRFCQEAVSAEASEQAVPCPNPACRTLCRSGKQKCPRCQAWIVVSCVFCGALSPCNVPSCVGCSEPFAGAPQRKAQMDQDRSIQQGMQVAQGLQFGGGGGWGGLAAALVGAAAGTVVGEALAGGGSSSYDSWGSVPSSSSIDFGSVSGDADDTTFDDGSSTDDTDDS